MSSGSETQKSDSGAAAVPQVQTQQVPLHSQINAGPSLVNSGAHQSFVQQGPEARQITSQLGGSSSGSVFPYNLYQNAVLNAAMQPPASSGGFLSMLRPHQGGRRSSLTSRLRNLMSAIFYRYM